MAKQVVANYTYNDAAKTVTLTDWATVRLDRLLLIVNATINEVMYNFADPAVTATVATNVITLSSVPAAAQDADKLLIFYDALEADPTYDAVPIQDGGNSITVDDGGSTLSVDDGAGSLTVDGSVSLSPTTSDGLTIHRTISAGSTNATSVKGSAGKIYGWHISSIDTTPVYVKFYNKASSPSVGSDTPVLTLLIPGNASGAAAVAAEFSHGIAFGTGIAMAITTGATDADATAVTANEVIVNLLYK